MKSIRTKIILTVILLVIALSVLSGGISCFLNYRSAMNILEKTMTETASVAADQVSAKITHYLDVVNSVGCVPTLSDPASSPALKLETVARNTKNYGFTSGVLIGPDGRGANDQKDYADEAFFKTALGGTAYISDPILDSVTGEIKINIAAPIWAGGIKNSTVVGVVAFQPESNLLNDIVSSINIGDTGAAYLLNQSGDTIAIEDAKKVCVENTQKAAQSDPSLKEIAEMERKMCAGQSGFATYSYENHMELAAYAPVPSTNGWNIAITAERDEFLRQFWYSIYITIVLALLFVAAGSVAATLLGSKISRPIRLCAQRLTTLAEGDLHSAIPDIKSRDETGVLANATGLVVSDLRVVVEDLSHLLSEMADGNFNIAAAATYQGDLLPLRTAADHIVHSLSRTLSQINLGADQVSIGSDQVSSGAQAISQGATEQASSVEELAATLNEISAQIHSNAAYAVDAGGRAGIVGGKITSSNQKMHEMTAAMGEISVSSTEIGKIIKTIEDIAFQTNILALNAAVEAARAGAAGKGFAVVADEVRNLASKSAAASKSTSSLISDSVRAVENGARIASEAALALDAVQRDAAEIVSIIGKISDASREQSDAISQVSLGVEQISAVVQTNSATAEESAAASEELSSQAQLLKKLISEFQLKHETGTTAQA